MTAIDLMTVRLHWAEDRAFRPAPHLLRGALGERFRDEPLFSQHAEHRLLYRYPLIHYRWDGGGAQVVALGDGVPVLAGLDWPGLTLQLGEHVARVREAESRFVRHTLALSNRLLRYRFRAPWLPFNQDTYAAYQACDDRRRVGERDRLAVAGLLMACRGVGVQVEGRVYAAVEVVSARPCRYKGVTLLGFTGRLLTNLDLPDGFACGRAVSHGYGWINRE